MSTPPASPAETDSPITLDDILTMKTVSQVALTPDGRTAAFVLREASAHREFPTGQICLLQVDDPERRPARRFTTGTGLDKAPVFSPDGLSLAFLSDREKPGTSQLYVIALSGGEAVRLTDERGGVAEPTWSPDGVLLSYLAIAAEPGEAEERKKDRDDAVVASEIKKRRRLWVCARDGASPRPLTAEDSNVFLYAWSPDGVHLAVVTAPTPEVNETFGRTRLHLISLDDAGQARDLGAVMAERLIWMRDGAHIVTLGGSVQEFPRTWLTFWPRSAGGPRHVLRELPATPFWLDRASNDDDLLVIAWQETHTPIYRVGAESGHAEILLEGDGSIPSPVVDGRSCLAASRDGSRMVMVRTGAYESGDLWLWEAGGALHRLTDVNPWLARRRLGRQQEIRWKSFDGLEIGGLLITPPDFQEGRRYPLVVNVHGGPTWLWTDHLHANWHDWGQWLAAAGFVVLLPNPRGSAGRGNDFAHANITDIGGGDYRDLIAGVDYLIGRGLVDESRMGIGGWSYGGTLTPWTITQTDRFKAALMGAGVCNWISFAGVSDIRIFADRLFESELHRDAAALWERSALRHVSRVTTPTLIVHGEQDVRVPVNQAYEFYSALRHIDVPVDLVVYPREGHTFVERHHQRDLLERIRDWFVRYLIA